MDKPDVSEGNLVDVGDAPASREIAGSASPQLGRGDPKAPQKKLNAKKKFGRLQQKLLVKVGARKVEDTEFQTVKQNLEFLLSFYVNFKSDVAKVEASYFATVEPTMALSATLHEFYTTASEGSLERSQQGLHFKLSAQNVTKSHVEYCNMLKELLVLCAERLQYLNGLKKEMDHRDKYLLDNDRTKHALTSLMEKQPKKPDQSYADKVAQAEERYRQANQRFQASTDQLKRDISELWSKRFESVEQVYKKLTEAQFELYRSCDRHSRNLVLHKIDSPQVDDAAQELAAAAKKKQRITPPSGKQASPSANLIDLAAADFTPAVAKYDYEGSSAKELSFKMGDRLKIHSPDPSTDLWKAELADGAKGWVSSRFVHLLGPDDGDDDARFPRYAVAKFDYEAQEEGELTFSEGDVIAVTEGTDDDGWWCGRLAGAGDALQFPQNYVELLRAAPLRVQAEFDYAAQEAGELEFEKGDLIDVFVHPDDEDWWIGQLATPNGGSAAAVGEFPKQFVAACAELALVSPGADADDLLNALIGDGSASQDAGEASPGGADGAGDRASRAKGSDDARPAQASKEEPAANVAQEQKKSRTSVSLAAAAGKKEAPKPGGAGAARVSRKEIDGGTGSTSESLTPAAARVSKSTGAGTGGGGGAARDSKKGSRKQPQPPPPRQASPAKPSTRFCVALFQFDGADDDDVSFAKGDVLVDVLGDDADDWLTGTVRETGRTGTFPKSYTKLVATEDEALRLHEELCAAQAAKVPPAGADGAGLKAETADDNGAPQKVEAIFSYEAQEEEELTFHVGDVIIITEWDEKALEDQGTWIKGYLGVDPNKRVGEFPSSYVKVLDDAELAPATKSTRKGMAGAVKMPSVDLGVRLKPVGRK